MRAYDDGADEDDKQDYAWVMSNGRHKEPFSFVWCCNALEIDADDFRDLLLERHPVARMKGIRIGSIVLDNHNMSLNVHNSQGLRKTYNK